MIFVRALRILRGDARHDAVHSGGGHGGDLSLVVDGSDTDQRVAVVSKLAVEKKRVALIRRRLP